MTSEKLTIIWNAPHYGAARTLSGKRVTVLRKISESHVRVVYHTTRIMRDVLIDNLQPGW